MISKEGCRPVIGKDRNPNPEEGSDYSQDPGDDWNKRNLLFQTSFLLSPKFSKKLMILSTAQKTNKNNRGINTNLAQVFSAKKPEMIPKNTSRKVIITIEVGKSRFIFSALFMI